MGGAHEPWYKNAVIYGVDVATFQDSNGDGIGDFAGLCDRLDYLTELGVTCLWLLPFFPTPNRDNGYDVKNYYDIDPRLGDELHMLYNFLLNNYLFLSLAQKQSPRFSADSGCYRPCRRAVNGSTSSATLMNWIWSA